jgi:hypothetical protein
MLRNISKSLRTLRSIIKRLHTLRRISKKLRKLRNISKRLHTLRSIIKRLHTLRSISKNLHKLRNISKSLHTLRQLHNEDIVHKTTSCTILLYYCELLRSVCLCHSLYLRCPNNSDLSKNSTPIDTLALAGLCVFK